MSSGGPPPDYDDYLTTGVLWRRCVAWVVDAVLIGLLILMLGAVLTMLGLLSGGFSAGLFVTMPLVPFIYHLWSLVGMNSATPGQKVFGLVVRRNDDLGPPTALQAFILVVLYYVTLATTGLLLIVALFTTRHRTLHDIFSGLVVVRAGAWQALTGADPYWNTPSGWYSPNSFPPPSRPMTYKPPRRPQFFYTTAPLPCPYVPGRTERKVVTEITGPDADALHDRLSRAGFRRSHNIAYAPVCPSCQSCIPIRIPVAAFRPDRTLRKIAKANADLEGFEVPARATTEQFQLFQRYQQVRHGEGDMATMSFYDYRAMVEDTPIETFIVEFRDSEDRLISACLTDRLADGLSAVYSFFAPGMEKRSLGTHAVLWLISRARALGLPYVYLGYWVPESRKMAYKSRFRPAEILAAGAWRTLGRPAEPIETAGDKPLMTEPAC